MNEIKIKQNKKCNQCNKVYYRPYPRTNKQWNKRKFCSRFCWYKFAHQENHPNFKGKLIDSNGYIIIYLPKSLMADRNGYIKEHRLVMSLSIGRDLSPKERVHHLNRIKTDNRRKNLQLFNNESEHQCKAHFNFTSFKYKNREKEYRRKYYEKYKK